MFLPLFSPALKEGTLLGAPRIPEDPCIPQFRFSSSPIYTPRLSGAGYDQIDVAACTAASIQVSHVPTAVDAATADTAIFLLLGALRNFNPSLQNLRQGSWRGNPPPPLGHDPEGKVLGILGMGGIGRNMKRKAEAFGMNVIYHNRRKLDEKMAGGANYVGFEELLKTSDVISLNLPLNVRLFLLFTPLSSPLFPLLCTPPTTPSPSIHLTPPPPPPPGINPSPNLAPPTRAHETHRHPHQHRPWRRHRRSRTRRRP